MMPLLSLYLQPRFSPNSRPILFFFPVVDSLIYCYWLLNAFLKILLIEGLLLYTILLFSVKPQHESATSIHIPLPFEPPSISLPIPPLQVDTEPLFEFPETYSKFPLTVYFTHGNVNFHVTLSIHLTLSSHQTYGYGERKYFLKQQKALILSNKK